MPAGRAEHLLGCRLEQVERGGEVNAVALGPAMRPVVPFERHAGVSPLYSCVKEHRQQAIEVRRAPEQKFHAFDHVALVERIWRNRRRDGE